MKAIVFFQVHNERALKLLSTAERLQCGEEGSSDQSGVLFSLLYLWRRIKKNDSVLLGEGSEGSQIWRFRKKNHRIEQSPGCVSLSEWDPQLSQQEVKRGGAYKS